MFLTGLQMNGVLLWIRNIFFVMFFCFYNNIVADKDGGGHTLYYLNILNYVPMVSTSPSYLELPFIYLIQKSFLELIVQL